MKLRQSVWSAFAVVALSAVVAVPSSLALNIDDGVPAANPRVGTQPTRIAEDFKLLPVAEGSEPVENPSGRIVKFGFLADGTKTEPDENTYLVLDHSPGGPDANFDYGRHFLFQGHENGSNLAYVTRVNLDVTDVQHRITLLTPVGQDGKTGFSSIDGSTWNPFSRTLLFTQENGTKGGVIQVTAGWPPSVTKMDGIMGQGGYEGVHIDNRGNAYLIEDAGGTKVSVNPDDPNSPKVARQPNGFVYRFVPYDVADLSRGGRLQALQVWIDGSPLVFTSNAVADTFSLDQVKLHTPGTSYPVRWVTIHDTAQDGFTVFDSNALAKAKLATPFKRPENIAFLPGSSFNTFFFDPTGDTDVYSGGEPALAARGAYGSIFRVDFRSNKDEGRISIFVLGDATHNSFDNLTFANNHTLLAAEDRGDTLHQQLNTLDSIWAFDVRDKDEHPARFVALGRDPLAFEDAQSTGEGDNEPTGVLVSDGDRTVGGLLYKRVIPTQVRWFFTQQHGMNVVYEVLTEDHDRSHD